MRFLKYFTNSFIVTAVGLALAAFVGFYYTPTADAALRAMFLTFILIILEISISFDNAVVNAKVLQEMTPKWQHRFLTWGMLIAVFGMRLVFPIMIVSIMAHINPLSAVNLALFRPAEYAQMMLDIHHEVSAFGGVFLLLVSLKYFFDREKEIHWIRVIESRLVKMGKLESIEIGIALLILTVFTIYADPTHQLSIIISGIAGIIVFLGVEAIGVILAHPDGSKGHDIEKISASLFIYLEVLDASFSFDGVIGAFAISNNIFIITIGLGVGAMFVRSLTILMVGEGTLNSFKYLEHGAFYAIIALALIMIANTVIHTSEIFTGLIGAVFIGLSIFSSMKDRKIMAD